MAEGSSDQYQSIFPSLPIPSPPLSEFGEEDAACTPETSKPRAIHSNYSSAETLVIAEDIKPSPTDGIKAKKTDKAGSSHLPKKNPHNTSEPAAAGTLFRKSYKNDTFIANPFSHSSFENCALTGSPLDRCSLKNCTITGCSVNQGWIDNCKVIGCSINRCQFTNQQEFVGLSFNRCRLTGEYVFIGCSFSHCQFEKKCEFRGCSFSYAKFEEKSDFVGCSFSHC